MPIIGDFADVGEIGHQRDLLYSIRMWRWSIETLVLIHILYLGYVARSMQGIWYGRVNLYYVPQAKDYARLTREMSSGRVWSQGSASSGGSGGSITAVAEELENGNIRVGKIVFDPQQLLGKGCDGTFVFQWVTFSLSLLTPTQWLVHWRNSKNYRKWEDEAFFSSLPSTSSFSTTVFSGFDVPFDRTLRKEK